MSNITSNVTWNTAGEGPLDSEALVEVSYDEAQQIRAVDTDLCIFQENVNEPDARRYNAKWFTYAWCREMRSIERMRARAYPHLSDLVAHADFGEAWHTLRADLCLRRAFMMCTSVPNNARAQTPHKELAELVREGMMTKEEARNTMLEKNTRFDLESAPAWQWLCAHFPNEAYRGAR